MYTIVSRFLLSLTCIALSGGFIISQEAPPTEGPPQEIVATQGESSQENKEVGQIKNAAPQEVQQVVPPEEVAGPEVGVMGDSAGPVGVIGAPKEVEAAEAKEKAVSVEGAPAQIEEPEEVAEAITEVSPVEKEEPEEAVKEAPPEEEIPNPKEEAEVVSEDKPTEVPVVPSELKGIDTLEINEPGGNWLVKRRWWEKAEEKIERVDSVIDSIMESRMVFFEERDKSDSELFDSFYIEVGMDQGQLEEISSFMIQELKDRREKQDVLNKQELSFLKKLESEKETLKEVRRNVEAVRKLDDAIDDALTKLVEQINLARRYRREAQQLFKDIAKVLDHEKARELYYKMDASWQNIKGIQGYINGKFTQHFNQLIEKAEEQVSSIKIAMADLEKKGLGFKEQLKKLRGEQEEREKKEQDRKKQEELKEKLEEEVEGAPGVFGVMLSTISNSFQAFWNGVISLVVSTWNWVASWWRAAPAEPVQVEGVVVETVEEVPVEAVVPVKVEEPSVQKDSATEPVQVQEAAVVEAVEETPAEAQQIPENESPAPTQEQMQQEQ